MPQSDAMMSSLLLSPHMTHGLSGDRPPVLHGPGHDNGWRAPARAHGGGGGGGGARRPVLMRAGRRAIQELVAEPKKGCDAHPQPSKRPGRGRAGPAEPSSGESTVVFGIRIRVSAGSASWCNCRAASRWSAGDIMRDADGDFADYKAPERLLRHGCRGGALVPMSAKMIDGGGVAMSAPGRLTLVGSPPCRDVNDMHPAVACPSVLESCSSAAAG